MRLKRKYISNNSIDDLNRNIRRNTSPAPGFSGNDFTYFKELNEAVESTKPLWVSQIYENKFLISSNSLFYWWIIEVMLDSVEEGTIVSVRYIGATIGMVIYSLLIMVFLGIIGRGIYQNPDDVIPLLIASLAFNLPMG